MRKLLIFIAIVAAICGLVILKNNNYNATISRLATKGIPQGGELRYRAYLFALVPVAEAIFADKKEEDYKGGKVYHLTATAKNLQYVSALFSGYAILDSFVDTVNLNSIEFKEKIVVTGKQDVYKEVVYDQKQGTMVIKGVSRQIFEDTKDPLALVATLRQFDFDKNREFAFHINTNQKNYILKGTATPKDIVVNNQPFRLYFLKSQISRKDKNPYHKSRIDIVMLKNGTDNIPVQIKVFASGFLINAKLTEIK